MGRLIDADKLNRKDVNCANVPMNFIDTAPTVEAIPKAEIKKFLEEGTKDVSNKVLAIVREDYIHKSVYEASLKADMVAMLRGLKKEIEQSCICTYDVDKLIQQKINELKEEEK